jgi:DNA polymerase (family 10)
MANKAQTGGNIRNEDIARIIEDIGDMLDILGENQFRVRAHRNAAASIRGYTRPLFEVYDAGGPEALTAISGIGEHTAKRIEQLLVTGQLPYYEELKAKVPPGLIELLNVPGLGPKKAKKLYDSLGIKSLKALVEAIEEHRLESLPGFGRKSEENILRGIKQFETMHERILLSEGYPIAREILARLREQPFVERADTAGSLRRMQETIGDIDLLCSSDEPAGVMEFFVSMPQVAYVLAQGETKSSIVVTNGLQLDLRVVTPEQYGAALQYFTGSKEHNVHLRHIAKVRGFKINEYGVFDVETDQRLAGKTEEEVYAILDMETPPPAIREDRGEIEAAAERRLPNLVELADIKGDFHIHTKWSDGLNSIEEVIAMAQTLGYDYIVISDHAEKLRIAGGLSVRELEEQLEVVAALNEQHADIEILCGMEMNIDNDGEVDFGPAVLEKLDVVIGSIHGGFTQPKEKLTARLLKALENPYINIIGHPTGRVLGQRPPYAIDIQAVFKAAAETGTFLELNSYPNRLDLKDDHLREAKDVFGCMFTINTDAHVAGNMTYMEYGVATAQRGWLTKEDVLNTYELAEVKTLLRRKR